MLLPCDVINNVIYLNMLQDPIKSLSLSLSIRISLSVNLCSIRIHKLYILYIQRAWRAKNIRSANVRLSTEHDISKYDEV